MKIGYGKSMLIAACVSLLSQHVIAEPQSHQELVAACTAINHDYALARDRADNSAYESLFTHDAEFIMQGKSVVGLDKIVQRLSDGSSPRFARLLITTVDIAPIDSTTATGITYFIMFQAPEGAEGLKRPITTYDLFMGEYHDHYTITPAGCKFSRRETKPLFWGAQGGL